jgi:hypothetical protein
MVRSWGCREREVLSPVSTHPKIFRKLATRFALLGDRHRSTVRNASFMQKRRPGRQPQTLEPGTGKGLPVIGRPSSIEPIADENASRTRAATSLRPHGTGAAPLSEPSPMVRPSGTQQRTAWMSSPYREAGLPAVHGDALLCVSTHRSHVIAYRGDGITVRVAGKHAQPGTFRAGRQHCRDPIASARPNANRHSTAAAIPNE